MDNINFKTPILLIIFNRPHLTETVFNVIKKIKPEKLYIASDGPRIDSKDLEKVKLARKIATNVNWKCQVKKLFRENNLGCGAGPIDAINWLFENENTGIILEDDCVPSPSFFYYCEALLKKFEHNENIASIHGNNFQNGRLFGDGSYYYSKYFHGWGWASWSRVWKNYDKKMTFWPSWRDSNDFYQKFPNFYDRTYWRNIFDLVYENKISQDDVWDYQFLAYIIKNGGVNIAPNYNLVSNIGFGKDATHTRDSKNKRANLFANELNKLVHPSSKIEINKRADLFDFYNHYLGKFKILPILLKNYPYYMLKKIKINFKKLFKQN